MASVPVDELDDLMRLILYSVNATGGKALDDTHLQKIIFQILKIIDADPETFDYRPHFYGPYSDAVEEEKKSLEEIGYLIERNGKIHIVESEVENVSLIKPPSAEYGFRIKNMIRDYDMLSGRESLLMIYSDDIESTGGYYLENSAVKDEIMADRESIAMGMYKGKKVSLERASELAGMNIRAFREGLMKRYGVIYDD